MKKSYSSTVLVATLAALATASAHAETLVVSNALPPSHVVSTQGFEPWMACVQEATDNEIDFDYFPSGQIAPVGNSIDSLNSGLAQVAFVSPTNEASKLPINGIPLLPGLGETAAELTNNFREVVDSNGPFADELARNNIRPLIVNSLPAYNVMSTGERIDTIDKFDGSKIRVAGGAMIFTVQGLGGVPVEMSAGDMYVALQRGTVDSTLLSYASVKAYGLQDLIESMSNNASFGTSAQMIAIGTDAWDSLSPPHQAALSDCGQKVEMGLAAHLDAEQEQLMEEFATMGIDIFEIPDKDMVAINESLNDVVQSYLKRLEDRGLPGEEAINQYTGAANN